MDPNEALMIFLAYFMIFLAFSPRRRRSLPPIDLLALSARARSLPVVVVSTYMRRFPRRFWHVQPRQYVYHDIVQDDVWHTTPEMLDREYWSASG
jgi:hypothetical protein